MDVKDFFIGGTWVRPRSTDRIPVVSPNTEQVIGSVPLANRDDVDAAVGAARRAFDDPSGWAHWKPAARAAAMRRLADAFEARTAEFARRISGQNGLPISAAYRGDARRPVDLIRYYADLLAGHVTEAPRPGATGGTTLVRRVPLGVVAAVVPWNAPQQLAAFKYAPALAAGCTVVLKPAPETVLDAALLGEVIEEAGLPAGVMNIVFGGREAGAELIAHPGVDKVGFTGSTAAGRQIGEVCGRLLRPVTLELGGKSAAIVLDDAELDLAAIGDRLAFATLNNNGQTCFICTRILAPRSRYREVVDLFAELARGMTVGDSLDPGTSIGPVVSRRQRERIEGYLARGRQEGGRIVAGGRRPADRPRGWFLEPTVFADVDNSHTIAREEIFGPVLAVIPYGGDDDAVRIANDSEYGLGGTVWSADHRRAVSVARRVATGTIGINGYVPDIHSPMGGVKASGLGSELGPEALAAYLRYQSVYL
jgi:aldehyde dehydrogenase (NAD+)